MWFSFEVSMSVMFASKVCALQFEARAEVFWGGMFIWTLNPCDTIEIQRVAVRQPSRLSSRRMSNQSNRLDGRHDKRLSVPQDDCG